MYYRFRRAEQKSAYDILPVGFPIPSTYPYQIQYKTKPMMAELVRFELTGLLHPQV